MLRKRDKELICHECKKPIKTKWYWYRWMDGEVENYCTQCASCMVDDRTSNGLLCNVNPSFEE